MKKKKRERERKKEEGEEREREKESATESQTKERKKVQYVWEGKAERIPEKNQTHADYCQEYFCFCPCHLIFNERC